MALLRRKAEAIKVAFKKTFADLPDLSNPHFEQSESTASGFSYSKKVTHRQDNGIKSSRYEEIFMNRPSATPQNEEEVPSGHIGDNVFLEHMDKILSGFPMVGVPTNPSPITATLHLGTLSNAENLDRLRRQKFTHLLDCGNNDTTHNSKSRQMFKVNTQGMKLHVCLGANDDEYFDLNDVFKDAFEVIESAKAARGKLMIYGPGVNLASAICIAYLVFTGTKLLEATRIIKNERRLTLNNWNFMQQLVQFAREHNGLETSLKWIRPTFEYGANTVKTVTTITYSR